MSGPRLELRGIAKRYGATTALAGVDLCVQPGEVHALVGENGAGKSTLIKVMAGVVAPDAGTMAIDGRPWAGGDPAAARGAGISVVHQELAIAPDLSVADNLCLGRWPASAGWLRRRERDRIAGEALFRLGHDLPLHRRAGDLGPGERQLIEIGRALLTAPRILILDEPTSSLTREDAGRLLGTIRRLAREGVAVILISHYLEEVLAVADRWTVLRDGAAVARGATTDTDAATLVRHMVGRSVAEAYPRVPHTLGEPVLTVDRIQAAGRPAVSLTLRAGEILGIFGLVGAGRTETLRALFGLDPGGGSAVLDGRPAPRRPAGWWRRACGMVSEDRKGEGLWLDLPIADNLTATRLAPYSTAGWLSGGRQRTAAAAWIRRLGVRCRDPRQPVGALSGGNQQKVAIGRLLHHGCRILLLDEPTRGVDIGAKAEIYRMIGEHAAAGGSAIVVSSYLPEILGLCDTAAALGRGGLSPVRPVAAWTETTLCAAALETPAVETTG